MVPRWRGTDSACTVFIGSLGEGTRSFPKVCAACASFYLYLLIGFYLNPLVGLYLYLLWNGRN